MPWATEGRNKNVGLNAAEGQEFAEELLQRTGIRIFRPLISLLGNR